MRLDSSRFSLVQRVLPHNLLVCRYWNRGINPVIGEFVFFSHVVLVFCSIFDTGLHLLSLYCRKSTASFCGSTDILSAVIHGCNVRHSQRRLRAVAQAAHVVLSY